MSPGAIAWAATGLGLLILVGLTVGHLVAAVREARRAAGRVAGYAELPLFAAAAKAERDLGRLQRAAAEADVLAFRAAVAIASLRRSFAALRLLRPF